MQERNLVEQLEQKFGISPTPSYLRQEAVLKNNKSSYEFTFSQSQDEGAEKTLKDQDLFFANAVGIFLLKETKGNEGAGLLQTYPNGNEFPDNATAGSEFLNSHLNCIYNGYIDSDVDKFNVLDGLDTRRFYYRPEQVEGATDGFKGFATIPKMLKLNGDRKNKFILYIPSFTGIQIEERANADINHKVVLYLRGFLMDGAARNDLAAQGR